MSFSVAGRDNNHNFLRSNRGLTLIERPQKYTNIIFLGALSLVLVVELAYELTSRGFELIFEVRIGALEVGRKDCLRNVQKIVYSS